MGGDQPSGYAGTPAGPEAGHGAAGVVGPAMAP